MMSNWRKSAPRVQKSVRFTGSDMAREVLEKETWRKLPSIRETMFAMSSKALQGKAIVKFAVSKMLFVRLPNARRPELEARCGRLLSSEQLASWWKQLSPSNQALVTPAPGNSAVEMESNFCEAMAEISRRQGSQGVTDTIVPLVVPVVAAWETSGDISNVEDTNEAAAIAAKGKKAGNALGDGRSRSTRGCMRRMIHYQILREQDLELVALGRASRFSESWVSTHGTDIQEFKFHFITVIRGPEDYDTEILGTAMSIQKVVAREFAAEQALANWHICEEFYQKILEPEQLVMNMSKSKRKRDRTRAGALQEREGTSQ